ncbi:MAG: iron-containing alcohol dehydrogenase [Clostridiales bacterium]|nr:iron-containing alcohol dehydrogenase [Clostridiales bacterium]
MAIMEYFTPTHVYFGKGAEDKAADVLKENGASHVLLHYGSGSVIRSGLLGKVKAELDEAGIRYTELGGVVPNPRVSLVRKGIELVNSEGIDFILAVGGGSVLDSAKAIGYGVYGGGDVWDFYCGKRKVEGTLPVGVILTLSATGSEMSDSSVMTNDETDPVYKRGVNTDYGRIKFALLDPELTYTVSAYQTSSGSTDIMMHTLERFFHQGYALDMTDKLSFALLREVMDNVPVALEHPDDYDARANLMWAGSISHNGLMAAGNANKGDWSCHQIEHELSAEYDVAHGAGLAAIWGSWARYVLDVDPARFSKLGEGVFGESDPVKTIEKFEEFFKSINMPTDIKGLGLDFDEAACRKAALGVTFNDARTIGNFKVLNTEDIFNIYMMAAGLK